MLVEIIFRRKFDREILHLNEFFIFRGSYNSEMKIKRMSQDFLFVLFIIIIETADKVMAQHDSYP